MKEYITLKGLVVSRYGTIAEFAGACGHSRQWASRVLNHPETLTIAQAEQIRDMLGIAAADMTLDIFLPKQ